jgi:transposase
MATERLSMRSVKEVLRQKWVLKKSHREVARSLGISAGAVGNTMTRAGALNLTWEHIKDLSEEELEVRLYGPKAPTSAQRPLPDPVHIHTELRRPGVTLELLHLEYLEKHPEGYRYTQFCEHYRQWAKKRRVTMRQVHRAGEKLFVDYSGKKPHLVDARTGECSEVELFVAVLGASSYAYAEATRTQQGPDFIASHARTLQYLGGVPAALVPDQLKSGVTLACRYEPGIQRTYEEMARHYGTVVLPARPARPRDKAKVEVGVQVVQRWLLARLRNQTFFTLEALNERIWELLEDLNNRPMRLYGASRRELFERMEKAALRPLPAEPFVYGEWKQVRVNIDYHVEVEHHYYSVPYKWLHQRLEARITATTVELFHGGERVAAHARSTARGKHTTKSEHMPKAHQMHLEWTPSRLVQWAGTIGPKTQEMVESILAERPHPEMGYRSCLGILRLAKHYGRERLEAACARAVVVHARSYRHVATILKNGLDRVSLPASPEPSTASGTSHENIRGGGYYH